MNNLLVTMVRLLGGPAPALVWALSCNTYTVSGDNSSIVYISSLLLKLPIIVPLRSREYCVITPLGVSGGLHCKVTELELTEVISNDPGSLGTAKLIC